MSKRAPKTRKNRSQDRGTSSVRGEARHWFRQKESHMWRGRINGLSDAEIGPWFEVCPPKGHLMAPFRRRARELIEAGQMSKKDWAHHITKADDETFEKYIERETEVEHLTEIIRAIGGEDERIGWINERIQELRANGSD